MLNAFVAGMCLIAWIKAGAGDPVSPLLLASSVINALAAIAWRIGKAREDW